MIALDMHSHSLMVGKKKKKKNCNLSNIQQDSVANTDYGQGTNLKELKNKNYLRRQNRTN